MGAIPWAVQRLGQVFRSLERIEVSGPFKVILPRQYNNTNCYSKQKYIVSSFRNSSEWKKKMKQRFPENQTMNQKQQ